MQCNGHFNQCKQFGMACDQNIAKPVWDCLGRTQVYTKNTLKPFFLSKSSSWTLFQSLWKEVLHGKCCWYFRRQFTTTRTSEIVFIFLKIIFSLGASLCQVVATSFGHHHTFRIPFEHQTDFLPCCFTSFLAKD